MKDSALEVQQHVAAWVGSLLVTVKARRDDEGAISVETAIITALLGAVAAGFGAFVLTRVTGWQDSVPEAP